MIGIILGFAAGFVIGGFFGFVICCILAASGRESAIEELTKIEKRYKRKHEKLCTDCKHFVGCECFDGKTCDEFDGKTCDEREIKNMEN